MSNIFARFVKDESGATAIEYGLIAALIALAIMVGAGAVGNAIGTKFNNIATALKYYRPIHRLIWKGRPNGAAFSLYDARHQAGKIRGTLFTGG